MDLPVLRGWMMSMMVGVREPSVHIVPQYIHIEGIWQVQMGLPFAGVIRSRGVTTEITECTEI
jgi:hypothetical protein